MAKEKNFENRIKDFLKDNGCWFIKYWGGGEYTKAGVPDILVCCNGYFVGVEVKAPKGKPSALQISNLQKIHQAGGIAVLLYPAHYPCFKNLIYNLKCRNDLEIEVAYRYLYEVWKSWFEKYRREGLLS